MCGRGRLYIFTLIHRRDEVRWFLGKVLFLSYCIVCLIAMSHFIPFVILKSHLFHCIVYLFYYYLYHIFISSTFNYESDMGVSFIAEKLGTFAIVINSSKLLSITRLRMDNFVLNIFVFGIVSFSDEILIFDEPQLFRSPKRI